MTPDERRTFVLAQNELGFEGDTYIEAEVKRLAEKHKVTTIVETGTYQGNTTLKFAGIVKNVLTIESNPSYHAAVQPKIKGNNVQSVLADSAAYLLSNKLEGVLFFYLDAHWGKVCPLLGELQAIAKNGYKPVIAIHDWQVPNKDFGFDKFPDGKPYTIDVIKPYLDAIYGLDGYTFHYNENAAGCYRGMIYIEPKIEPATDRFPSDDEQKQYTTAIGTKTTDPNALTCSLGGMLNAMNAKTDSPQPTEANQKMGFVEKVVMVSPSELEQPKKKRGRPSKK